MQQTQQIEPISVPGSASRRPGIRIILAIVTGGWLSGCSTVSYYSQAVTGHMQLLVNARPVQKLLHDPHLAPALRQQLQQALALRDFAATELQLPQNRSYTRFTATGREFALWNVFAAPEFSLQPVQSCFLIVGCLSYRGFFAKSRATAYAATLKTRGFDVYTGGVVAYSTLGWFADPLLDTMFNRGPVELARLMFHELAHQLIYIEDDTTFNESFAESVAQIGVSRWLLTEHVHVPSNEEQKLQFDSEFSRLVLAFKNQLESVYASDLSDREKRRRKREILAQLSTRYTELRRDWPQFSDHDRWIYDDMNNAKLLTVATYRELVPHLLTIFERLHENMPAYYNLMRGFAECEHSRRRELIVTEAIVAKCD